MKIKAIHITEFGALKDFSLEFSDSLNIITGDNESGKSTVLLFITYMLYGLAKKGAHASVDKARSISWESSRACGHMDVEKDGRLYRITRALKGKTSVSKVSVFELEGGTELEGVLPADLFLEGISRETFESCCLCGQLRSSSIHGTEVAQSLSNLSLSADQSVNAAEVINTVRNARKEYKHERGKGGLIDEANDEIEALLAEKLTAKKAYDSLTLDREALANKQSERELAEKRLEAAEQKKDSLAALTTLSRFDELRKTKNELDAVAASLEKLKTDSGFGDSEPTESELAELRHVKREYEVKLSELEILENAPTPPPAKIDLEAKEFAERIIALGGKEAYLSAFEADSRSVKALGVSGLICAALGALSLLASVFTPILIAVGAPLALFSALCFFFSAKKKKEHLGKYSALAKSGMPAEKYISYAFAQLELFSLESSQKAKSKQVLRAAKEQLERINKLVTEKLCARNREKKDYDGLCSLINDISVYLEKREAAKQRAAVLSAMVTERQSELEGDDEQALRASLSELQAEGLSPDAVNEEYRLAVSEQKRISEELTSLIIKIKSAKVNEGTLAELDKKISEAEEKKALYLERYGIYDLALRSLENARDNLQNTFAPEVRKRAGELLSQISLGKYSHVFLSKDLEISVEGGAVPRPAELLSAGTSDAVYVALRMALIDNIFESDIPLFLDETLSQVDDKRALSVLSILSEFVSAGNQCLLFTCHKREAALCCENGIAHNIIKLG